MKTTGIIFSVISAVILSTAVRQAQATPVTFTNINVTSSNQSRINMAAAATIGGTPLTSAAQFPAGGLNGNGSESTLYNQTASNTPSNMATTLGLYSIGFPGGSVSSASTTVSAFSTAFPLAPGVGGTTGTAAGDYGFVFTQAQDIVIPPIDISALGIPGFTTLNLGTLTGINLNVALRSFVLDLHSGIIPMSGGGGYPAQFDATQVGVALAGNADMSLTGTFKQANLTDWLAAGAVLTALQSALAGQGVAITLTGNIFQLNYQVGFGFTAPVPAGDIANTEATLGKVEHISSNLRLTLPVKFDFAPVLPSPLDSLLAADFSMTGQLIGQAPFQVVPEPSTIALALTGLAGVVVMARRRPSARR